MGHAGRPGKRGGSLAGSGGLAKIGAKPGSSVSERAAASGEKRGQKNGKSAKGAMAKPVSSGSKVEDRVLDEAAGAFKKLDFYTMDDFVGSGAAEESADYYADTDAEFDRLKKRKTADWDASFKKRFGMSGTEMADRVQAEDMKKWSPSQKSVSAEVGKQLTVGTLSPMEFKREGVTFKKRKKV